MPEEGNLWSYGNNNLSQESTTGYEDNDQSESNTLDFSEINRNIVSNKLQKKATKVKSSKEKWIVVNKDKSSKKRRKKEEKKDSLYIESIYENLSHEELNNALHRDFPDDLVTHDLKFTTEKEIASAFRVVRQLNVLDPGPDSDHTACVSNWMQKLKRALGVDTFEGEFL
jgi:hypothetical protein